MRIEHLLFSVLMLGLLSCRSSNNQDSVSAATDTVSEEVEMSTQRNADGEAVRTTLIDSLKWVLYAFNYQSQAISEETRNKVRPVACDLKLVEMIRSGKDTCVYYFDAFYKNKTDRYVFFPTDYIGVGAIKDSIKYLLGSHFVSDPVPDRIFFSRDSVFTEYLKGYNGKINGWLKKEAIKRRVLK